MKYVISFLIFLFFSSLLLALSPFYKDTLKKAAIQNGYKSPIEMNQSFDIDKSQLGKKFFNDPILSINTNSKCQTCHLNKFS